MAAAVSAAPHGFAGMAMSMLGVDLYPPHCLAVAGASLVLGGLAGFARADWRAFSTALIKGTLESALRALSKTKGGRRDDGGDDAASE